MSRAIMHIVLQEERVHLATQASLVLVQVAAQVLAVPKQLVPQPASEEASGAATASDALDASAMGASAVPVGASTEPAL